MTTPLVLCILDGWGHSEQTVGNAIAQSHTPMFDRIREHYPHALLGASGEDVGLPRGQTGNSEAGHINLGAGRIVEQDAVYISEQIQNKTFFKNAAFLRAIKHVEVNESTLHLMGLLSDGQSGHMLPEHLYALIDLAAAHYLTDVVIHLFTDGRDSPPRSALQFVEDLEDYMAKRKTGRIGTVMGRHYAMDRAKSWERTLKAYNALTNGSNIVASSARDAIKRSYGLDVADEYIVPTSVVSSSSGDSLIDSNDAVIFFNLRSDRARQITKAFVQTDFEQRAGIQNHRQRVLENLLFIAMTDFGPDLPNVVTAYPSRDVKNSLPFAWADLRQLYIAEAEKYAHMTYFFNGGYKDAVAGEDRVLVPSLPAKTYSEAPHMSAERITTIVVDALNEQRVDVIGLNFANADMVAHTGDINATIEACEFIDQQIRRIADAVDLCRGIMAIVGDHGNAEAMINPQTSEINTHHDPNPVPFMLYGESVQHLLLREHGVLGNVAPTILQCMGREIPAEMTCESLIRSV